MEGFTGSDEGVQPLPSGVTVSHVGQISCWRLFRRCFWFFVGSLSSAWSRGSCSRQTSQNVWTQRSAMGRRPSARYFNEHSRHISSSSVIFVDAVGAPTVTGVAVTPAFVLLIVYSKTLFLQYSQYMFVLCTMITVTDTDKVYYCHIAVPGR